MSLRFAILTVLTAVVAQAARADDAAAEAPTPLPKVTVVGEHESEGYRINSSRSATKTDTALVDVPQSVSVVTRDLIQDQSMQSLMDVARYVPGAGMAQGEGNRDAIILRGNSSTSDFFLDGVRDDVEYFRDLYNLDRVEILKGPNAMIFGRGGAGGVVNRVSRQANWQPVREVSLQGGAWDNMRATFDFGDAVSEGFAARVTGVYEDSESYRDGFELERKGINPTVALAIGESTVLRMSYEYYDYDRVADRGIPSLAAPTVVDRPFRTDESTFFGDPDQSPTYATVNQGSITIDHAFNDNVNLRNRTVYADYDKFYQNVYAGGAVDPATNLVPLAAYNNQQLRENFFNQTDLTFSAQTGSVGHEFLVGMELGEQTTDNLRMTGLFNGTDAAFLVSAEDPMVSVPVTFAPTETDNTNHGTATIAAIYVQDQVQLSQNWLAVVGLRYDNFEMDFRDRRGAGLDLETSDDLLSPRGGLIYKPAENLSLYASYSMTYVPRSGAQLASLALTNEALDPEEFENIEVGAKWDLNPSLALTAAVFQLDRKNVAIPDPNDPTVSILVDGQRTEGIELGASGQVSESWSIQGGYAYQDGHLTDRLGGTTLAQLPKHVASLWNRYDFTPAWGVGLGVVYQTEMFAAADNLVELPGFTRVDAGVFYTPNERLRMQLNVENLFDEEYYPNAHNNNNITPGSPPAVRASVIASF
ncbi:MAG TPA: TonB-dependent siderophore receptor [Steroidobacteraceae bacterium]|nr:TonB-dependent siderophore receptor [Steroidobacteraceae bacterium]